MLVRALIIGVVSGGLTGAIAWSSFIPDPFAFHSVSLAAIGAIYIGFAFSDGRPSIVILEGTVATGFLVVALLGLWVAPAFVAVGLVLHGLWDLGHRPHVIPTKLPAWYPPFCAAFDFVLAGLFLVASHTLASRMP
jgi:hypothetical protein